MLNNYLYTVGWRDNKERMRAFFDQLAYDKGFHSTEEPNGWYGISREDILGRQVYKKNLTTNKYTQKKN